MMPWESSLAFGHWLSRLTRRAISPIDSRVGHPCSATLFEHVGLQRQSNRVVLGDRWGRREFHAGIEEIGAVLREAQLLPLVPDEELGSATVK